MIFLDTLEQKKQELTDNLLKLEVAIIIINYQLKKEKEV